MCGTLGGLDGGKQMECRKQVSSRRFISPKVRVGHDPLSEQIDNRDMRKLLYALPLEHGCAMLEAADYGGVEYSMGFVITSKPAGVRRPISV